MGRPKLKVIDDSKPQEEVKKTASKKAGKDELVEKLKAELGITEEAPKAKVGSVEPTKQEEAQKTAEEAESQTEETQPKEEVKEAKPKQKPKVGKAKYRSKKYLDASDGIDPETNYSLAEAVELAKKGSYSKFEGTFEIHLVTNLKNLRGSVALPYASGKKKTILAFGKGAESSGADLVGDDKKLEEISKGKIDFDILLTTPEWMPKLAGLAKVLGPKGLMPNPKNGTITDDLSKAVSENQTGKLDYKTESNAKVMHLSIGKVSQPTEELTQNVKVLIQTLGKTKIRKAVLSPTMGPGVKLDLSNI